MELRQSVRNFIVSNLISFDDDAEFSDEDNIFQLGYVNSLFAMKLLNYVEAEFHVKVENEDMNLKNFSSVDRIVGLIKSKQKTSV